MFQSFTFNGIKKEYLTALHRKRSYWTTRQLVLSEKMKRGAVLQRVKRGVRVEEVTVEIAADSPGDLRNLAEDLSSWLLTETIKELTFDDEPNRRYLAIVDGTFEPEEIVTHGYGTIRFLVPDGNKLGLEKTIPVTTSNTTHTITGQDETPWEVNVTFNQNTTTFELETNKGLYLLLGFELKQGDRLTIKYEGREVWLNDTRDLRFAIRLKSNYEMLQPGSLRVKASHACTLKYDERFY